MPLQLSLPHISIYHIIFNIDIQASRTRIVSTLHKHIVLIQEIQTTTQGQSPVNCIGTNGIHIQLIAIIGCSLSLANASVVDFYLRFIDKGLTLARILLSSVLRSIINLVFNYILSFIFLINPNSRFRSRFALLHRAT